MPWSLLLPTGSVTRRLSAIASKSYGADYSEAKPPKIGEKNAEGKKKESKISPIRDDRANQNSNPQKKTKY